jgi:hypothetical protein
VGYHVYKKSGLTETIWYLLGVIFVEFFVIYFTLIFAHKLVKNQKLIQFIEGFSVLFMFVLAYVFYSTASSEALDAKVLSNYYIHPFIFGIVLSCSNFIQIPFWVSWNLYLLNGKHIEVSNSRKYFYVFGTVWGTFAGMLLLILSLNFASFQVDFLSKYLLKVIIPFVFIGLGFFQGYTFYKKYSK